MTTSNSHRLVPISQKFILLSDIISTRNMLRGPISISESSQILSFKFVIMVVISNLRFDFFLPYEIGHVSSSLVIRLILLSKHFIVFGFLHIDTASSSIKERGSIPAITSAMNSGTYINFFLSDEASQTL